MSFKLATTSFMFMFMLMLTASNTAADDLDSYRTRYGLHGDKIARTVFGPFEPGPVQAEVFAPLAGSWIDGPCFVVVIANNGKKPVDLEWFRTRDPQTRDEELEVFLGDHDATKGSYSWSLNLPKLRIAPGETWTYTHYIDSWNSNGVTVPVLGVSLHARLRQGEQRGELHIRKLRGWEMAMRPETEKEAAVVVGEVADLGKRELGPADVTRLLYLLRFSQRPQTKLSVTQIQAAYEQQSAPQPDLADLFFDALIDAAPQKDVLDFAVQRIRGGDVLPLRRCTFQLSRDLASSVVKLLDAKSPETRRRAIEFLAAIEDKDAGEQIAARLADPDVSVRSAALAAVGRLQVPCADKVAALLNDPETQICCEAAQTLVSMQARDQVAALERALHRHKDPFVLASIVGALGQLGGSVESVLPYVSSKDPTLRASAIGALGDLKAVKEIDRIVKFLDSDYGSDQSAAAYALGRLKSRRHVGLLADKAQTHEALAMTVVYALAAIGGDEALTALRGFAVDRPITYDRGLARSDAVRALAEALPADKRKDELAAILKNPKAHESARLEAVRQLGRLGKDAVPALQAALADNEVGLQAMWELARISAPKPTAQSFPPPLKAKITVAQLKDFKLQVEIEGLEGLPDETLYLYAPEHLTMETIFFALAGLRGGKVGVIVTEKSLLVVPRDRALEHYRKLVMRTG